jgi:ribosomal protein S18 acetylase RimI-like enzyme
MADEEKLKRERAGTYRTADGRFIVEQSSTGWLVLDSEQTNELGLPLARGPFATLDEARAAVGEARHGPRPVSDLDERRRAPRSTKRRASQAAAPPGASKSGSPSRAGTARRAAKRATGLELVVREIRTADGDSLRNLWKAVGFRSVGDDDRSLARLARRNPGLVLVATEGSRIIGSALGAWDGRRGWIYHVATAESHRRRGVATKLIAQIEAGLGDLGCPKVNVVVRDESEEGRAFWKARGYTPGQSRHYGKELDAG